MSSGFVDTGPLGSGGASAPAELVDRSGMLADVLEVDHVLTLDRRGFSTYRTSDGGGFRLVLDEA